MVSGSSKTSETSATGKSSLISVPSRYARVLAIACQRVGLLARPALALLLLLVRPLLFERLAGLLRVVLLRHLVGHASSMASGRETRCPFLLERGETLPGVGPREAQ